jgi:hypothetical protein
MVTLALHPHPPRESKFTLGKVDNCISIRRSLRTLGPEELPLDEICARLDTAAPPSNAPSNPHDTRRGHPYLEYLSSVESPEKYDKLKYYADVDR